MKRIIAVLMLGLLPGFLTAQTARYETGDFYFLYPSNDWKLKPGLGKELAWLVLADETAADPNDAKIGFHAAFIQTPDSLDQVVKRVLDGNVSSGRRFGNGALGLAPGRRASARAIRRDSGSHLNI